MTVTKREAKALGIEHGRAAARFVEIPPKEADINSFIDQALDAELNARQYSPFEVFAKELNNSTHPDDLWDAYDDGVYAGILGEWPEWKRRHLG